MPDLSIGRKIKILPIFVFITLALTTLIGCGEQHISGRIVDQNNNPVPGVKVDFYEGTEALRKLEGFGSLLDRYKLSHSAETDSKGYYSITSIDKIEMNADDLLNVHKDGYLIGAENSTPYEKSYRATVIYHKGKASINFVANEVNSLSTFDVTTYDP